jgi:hypothetical protein
MQPEKQNLPLLEKLKKVMNTSEKGTREEFS